MCIFSNFFCPVYSQFYWGSFSRMFFDINFLKEEIVWKNLKTLIFADGRLWNSFITLMFVESHRICKIHCRKTHWRANLYCIDEWYKGPIFLFKIVQNITFFFQNEFPKFIFEIDQSTEFLSKIFFAALSRILNFLPKLNVPNLATRNLW